MADEAGLEQVVGNLVENAVEHGRPPVTVAVEGVEAGVLEVAVTDNGEGVPDQLVPTLFSRVEMLARPNRDRSRGTGLGLPLVRGLVEAIGGRVWYEPAPGGGACFRFTVPVPNRRRGDRAIQL